MRNGAVVRHLGRHMPLGVMVILAADTPRGVDTATPPAALPFAAAVAITVGLHLRRANALPGILSGTAVPVALATAPAGG